MQSNASKDFDTLVLKWKSEIETKRKVISLLQVVLDNQLNEGVDDSTAVSSADLHKVKYSYF